MIDRFAIRIFFADGGPPESGERHTRDLSAKWIGICDDLLTNNGPVLNKNLSGTLSHFNVSMVGPVIDLHAYGHHSFRIAISLGNRSKQDHEAVVQFRELLTRIVASTGNIIAPEAMQTMERAENEPSVLIIDALAPIDETNKLALLQFGEHLAGAYMKYCEE